MGQRYGDWEWWEDGDDKRYVGDGKNATKLLGLVGR